MCSFFEVCKIFYLQFYLSKHNGRKLQWQHSLSQFLLRAQFGNRVRALLMFMTVRKCELWSIWSELFHANSLLLEPGCSKKWRGSQFINYQVAYSFMRHQELFSKAFFLKLLSYLIQHVFDKCYFLGRERAAGVDVPGISSAFVQPKR